MYEKKNIMVSNEFVEIYKHFNVISQVEKMNKLSRKELFLMLILAFDNFSEDNNIVIENTDPFNVEVKTILSMMQDQTEDTEDFKLLKELQEETGEQYVDTERIVDMDGNLLPKPLTDTEAIELRRDINISEITKI